MRMERDIHVEPRGQNGRGDPVRGPIDRARAEANSLGILFRQLGDDASTLVRDEMELAKVEMRREARAVGSDLVQAFAAVGMVLLGVLAATAFVIIALGGLLDENYWLSSLIVAAVLLIGGGLWAAAATKKLKEDAGPPQQTMESLREDARWAKQEAQAFKDEVRN